VIQVCLHYFINLQKLKTDLECEKKQHLKVGTELNQQKVTLAATRREVELERQRVQSVELQMRGKVTDLQTALDMERARCTELSRYVYAVLRQQRNSSSTHFLTPVYTL